MSFFLNQDCANLYFWIFGSRGGRVSLLSLVSHRGPKKACGLEERSVKSWFFSAQGWGLERTGLPPRTALPQLPHEGFSW
jgi:hypothetical protein